MAERRRRRANLAPQPAGWKTTPPRRRDEVGGVRGEAVCGEAVAHSPCRRGGRMLPLLYAGQRGELPHSWRRTGGGKTSPPRRAESGAVNGEISPPRLVRWGRGANSPTAGGGCRSGARGAGRRERDKPPHGGGQKTSPTAGGGGADVAVALCGQRGELPHSWRAVEQQLPSAGGVSVGGGEGAAWGTPPRRAGVRRSRRAEGQTLHRNRRGQPSAAG